MRANAVLICAALLADSTVAAARRDILNIRRPRQQQASDSLDATVQTPSPSSASTLAADFKATPSSSSLSAVDPTQSSVHGALPLFTTDSDLGISNAIQSSADSLEAASTPASASSDNVGEIQATDSHDATSTPTSRAPATTDQPMQTSISDVESPSSSLACSDSEEGYGCSPVNLTAFTAPVMATKFALLNSSSTSTSEQRSCTPFPYDKPLISYSIVYTSTTTFYGNPSDYTPPFETIKTPDYCTVIHSSTPITTAPILTITASPWSNSSVPGASAAGSSSMKPFLLSNISSTATLPIPTTTSASLLTPLLVFQISDASKSNAFSTFTMRPVQAFKSQVVTLLTTAKNPAVQFATQVTPDFRPTFLSIPDSFNPADHRSAENVQEPTPAEPMPANPLPTPKMNPVNSVNQPVAPTFSVVAGANTVMINDQTIGDLQPDQTSTVTVGQGTFTVLPTAVEGMGSTIVKPAPQQTAMPSPTSAVVGGVRVAVSGAQAVIGGTTLRIPSRTTATTNIEGHVITLAPGAVAVGTESLTFVATTPRPSNQVIMGAQIMTAIGKSIVVLDSTTITYGASISSFTTVIGGELITVARDGVHFRGTTVGGILAAPTATELDVIGGITLAKLANHHIYVNGKTFDIDAEGGSLKTEVIDKETITIGKRGLIVSSTTIAYPSDIYVTATLEGTGTWIQSTPVETSTQDGVSDTDSHQAGDGHGPKKVHKNGSTMRRPTMSSGILCLCFVIGIVYQIR